jgi:hypothetical protein
MYSDIGKLLEDMRGLQEQLEQVFAFGDARGYQQGLKSGRLLLKEGQHDEQG